MGDFGATTDVGEYAKASWTRSLALKLLRRGSNSYLGRDGCALAHQHMATDRAFEELFVEENTMGEASFPSLNVR
jgi:hypothetical protein